MQTGKIVAITIALAALAGAFAVVAYGYGMGGAGMMSGQYPQYSNYQGQNPQGYQGWGGSGMMGNGMMGNGMMGYNGQGMMGNNWQGMTGFCHSYMYQYRYNVTYQPNQVFIIHYSFVPSIVTVSEGTTVTWTNLDPVVHTVESGTDEQPTELFDSGPLSQGQSFSYTFTEPGVYVYHCDPHPYMLGVVIVQ